MLPINSKQARNMKKWINFDFNGVVIAIYATTSIYFLFLTCTIMNAVMAKDMVILANKGEKAVQEKLR